MSGPAVQDRSVVDRIVAQLDAIPLTAEGALVITPQAFNTDTVAAFFTDVLQSQSLIIAAPVTKTKTPTGIAVSGKSEVLGYKNLDSVTLAVSWNDADKEAVLSIEIGRAA